MEEIRKMTCKDVAQLLTKDLLADMSARYRVQVRLHLWMCEHCGRLEQQLKRIGEAARLNSRARDQEQPSPGADSLEARISRKLLGD